MSLKRMKRFSVSSLLLLLPAVLMAGDLASDFDTPPAAARPWVRWWWLDRQSEEGITLELEAVKEQGIGGVLIYACNGGILPDEVFGPREEYWTPEWLAMVEFAAMEAKRLGLEVKFNNVATSSGSGGPWISIEDSGKKLVWSCEWINGGSNVTVQLPQPEILDNYYLDTTVVAYPCPVDIDTMRQAAPELSASTSEFNADKVNLIVDADDTTHWSSLLETPGGEYIDITFEEDYTASSVYIVPRTGYTPTEAFVQVSTDGVDYTTITNQALKANETVNIPFSTTTSRYFRIAFPASYNLTTRMGLSELRLLAPGETSDMVVCPFPSFALQSASSRFSLTGKEILFNSGDKNTSQATPHMTTNEVVDLSAYMSTNGVLTWDAPAGNWMILRFGQTSIGKHNHINTGIGYHVDYLNPDALQKHFELGIDPMLNALSPEARAQVGGIYEDSFELPYHTWTEDFAAEFEARRGYSILPWMPVLAERVVNSQAESERFLWDYRRTIADLYITHYEAFRDLAHARGLETMVQGAGPQTYNFDALTQLGKADIPQGEFWSTLYKPGVEQEDTFRIWNNETCETTRQAASAAHIYGKNIVAAEAFTGYGRPFSLDFFDIKGLGDRALCNGVNRFVYHLFMTQAREEYNGKPVVVRLHALDYNRRSTWFDQSHLFNEYLARCSAMMQSGSPVADIAYYMGEGAPAFMPPREFISPEMPAGYDYDGCNTEILLQAAVENGRITFPSGTSYALLVFPTGLHSLTPAVLNHLKTLVQAGAVILGDKPEYSPELLGNDVADAQVQSLADELWGTSGTASGENVYGSGKVIWGKTVQEAMASTGCEPACEITGADTIRFIQRSTDDGEVFFLSQQAGATANFTASFKAESTVVPELWDPATGMREPVAVFKQANGRVDIPMKLAPKGSIFVVLKPATPDTHLASAVYDGLATVPLTILSADYTSTVDTNKTADVTDAVRDAVTNNSLHIRVFFTDLGIPDPAPGEVKRLTVYYTQGEESSSVSNTDTKYVTIDAVEGDADYRIAKEEGNIVLTSFVKGNFKIEWDNSAADTITVSSLPDPLDLSTDWELTFEGLGQTNNMQNLISWTDLVPEEQKYYSGTVTYRKSFNWSGSGTAELNLGSMKNIADVYLNGTLVDTLWKPPYRTDITSALLQGNNDLEIKVTNLRVNRVTGDYALPQEQKDAYYYGHVEKYRPGVESGLDGPLPSGLFGPVTVQQPVRLKITNQ